jgi:hypothetical protein
MASSSLTGLGRRVVSSGNKAGECAAEMKETHCPDKLFNNSLKSSTEIGENPALDIFNNSRRKDHSPEVLDLYHMSPRILFLTGMRESGSPLQHLLLSTV